MDVEALKDFINRYRHHSLYQKQIRSEIAALPPEIASDVIVASIWHPDGANATTVYCPSAYEHLLHRDLLLAANCVSHRDGLEPSVTRTITEAVLELYVANFKGSYNATLHNALFNAFYGLGKTRAGNSAYNDKVAQWSHRDTGVARFPTQPMRRLSVKKDKVVNVLVAPLGIIHNYVVWYAALTLVKLGLVTTPVLRVLAIATANARSFAIHRFWTALLSAVQKAEESGLPLPPDAYLSPVDQVT